MSKPGSVPGLSLSRRFAISKTALAEANKKLAAEVSERQHQWDKRKAAEERESSLRAQLAAEKEAREKAEARADGLAEEGNDRVARVESQLTERTRERDEARGNSAETLHADGRVWWRNEVECALAEWALKLQKSETRLAASEAGAAALGNLVREMLNALASKQRVQDLHPEDASWVVRAKSALSSSSGLAFVEAARGAVEALRAQAELESGAPAIVTNDAVYWTKLRTQNDKYEKAKELRTAALAALQKQLGDTK